MFYSNTVVYGGKLVWYTWSLVLFHIFKALNDAFELHICTFSKTLIAFRVIQLRFFFI